ncbi:MAG: outer membrane beta-barrel protein [Chthoniobacterales bacterium]
MCAFSFPWRSRRLVLLAGLSVLGLSLARPAAAQNPGSAQDRADLVRTTAELREDPSIDATGTDSSHAVASPNDPDLGEQAILKREENYQAWTFFAAAPFSYTSNVALVRSGEQGDGLFSPALGLTYAPRISKTLYANFGLSQQFFYYDNFRELNFASFDLRAGLVYTLPRLHNLLLRADYDFNRLSSDDLNDEFFTNHSLNFGAELPFRIGRAQQISVGGDVSFSVAASPSPPARNDYSAFVGYSVNLTRDLTMNAVARVAVRDYVDSNRTDVSGIFGLGANFRFNKWLSVSANTTYATNASNRDVFEYDVFNIGGALSVNVRF